MTNCEACAYYSYDEDYECYICEMDLDEDEMLKFLSSTFDACPYYVPEMNTALCGTRCDGAWEKALSCQHESFFKSGRHSLSLNFYIPIIINL